MLIDWTELEETGLLRLNTDVRPLYDRAKEFRFYSSQTIPGPVQSEARVRHILTTLRVRRGISADDVEQAVAERMDRQAHMLDGERHFQLILEEQSLRIRLGGNALYAGQLRHLLEAMQLPGLALGIIPASTERLTYWPVEPFFIFDAVEVHSELVSHWLRITEPKQIHMYEDAFTELDRLAVFGSPAAGLVSAALAELDY